MSASVGGTNFAGLARVKARMLELARSQVLVGVPAGKVEPDGTSMGLVAAMTEFGNPAVGSPERPFLRMGIKRAMPGIEKLNRSTTKRVVDGTMAVGTALDLIGVYAVGEIKQGMVTGPWAPNKPSTIARKKSSKPTIDSGNLRQSIVHVVEGKVA